ncbi:hypothetical protein [Mycolicibacterium sp. XJ870]
MSAWINLAAVGKILLFGLLLGAAVPVVFAAGVRLNAVGAGDVGAGATRNRVLTALSWVIVTLVLAVVVLGVLFIARDFIGHHTGWYILGAEAK